MRTLDELWKAASGGKFGYSVQREIWLQNRRQWPKFFKAIDWVVGENNVYRWAGRAGAGGRARAGRSHAAAWRILCMRGRLPCLVRVVQRVPAVISAPSCPTRRHGQERCIPHAVRPPYCRKPPHFTLLHPHPTARFHAPHQPPQPHQPAPNPTTLTPPPALFHRRKWPAEFNYSVDAPKGHLPLTNALRGTRLFEAIMEHEAFNKSAPTLGGSSGSSSSNGAGQPGWLNK